MQVIPTSCSNLLWGAAIDLTHAVGAKGGEDYARAELTADHLICVRPLQHVACDKRHWCFEEPRRDCLVLEQSLHFPPQRRIPIAHVSSRNAPFQRPSRSSSE